LPRFFPASAPATHADPPGFPTYRPRITG
jgi:hypothetical protein